MTGQLHSPPDSAQLIEQGARLALQYRYLPSWQLLAADHGISRATAYRWRGALQRAGLPPRPTAGSSVYARCVHSSSQGRHA